MTNLPSCHCTRLRRVAQHLTQAYDDALSGTGVKVTQYGVLRTIQDLETPNLSELATATGLDRSTLGRNVRVLAREGLVALATGESDERSTTISLTTQGRQSIARAAKRWSAMQAQVEAALSPSELKALNSALEKLAEI